MINKKKIFYAYTDFQNMYDIGMTWINRILGYMPVGVWIQKASIGQIALWALNDKSFLSIHITIPAWLNWGLLFAYYAFTFYFMIFLGWVGGKIAIKVGLRDAELQYEAKKKHLNPYQVEIREQLQEIAKKVGAENKFSEL